MCLNVFLFDQFWHLWAITSQKCFYPHKFFLLVLGECFWHEIPRDVVGHAGTKYVLFCFDAIFCGTNFFIFGVKSSFNSSNLLGSDSCRSEFALWWFFVWKKLSSQYWQFFFLFGLDYQTLFEFSQIWKTVVPFWVWWCLYYLLRVPGSLMRFFSLQVFPFLITVLADIVILMCSFSIIYSFLLV